MTVKRRGDIRSLKGSRKTISPKIIIRDGYEEKIFSVPSTMENISVVRSPGKIERFSGVELIPGLERFLRNHNSHFEIYLSRSLMEIQTSLLTIR